MVQFETEIGGRTLSIQTGKVAKQSAGSVLVTYGETTVLAAVNAAHEPREGIDYFPLQVEYRERFYAGGKIPGGFFKREARPSETEILTSRLTDRPIRPLFPKAFRCETQVVVTALSSDGENLPDVLAGIGASAALMISDIPWEGPIATVRVGLHDEEFILNPTRSQIETSKLNLIVSGNEQSIVMVEGAAEEVAEEILVEALKFAHDPIKDIIKLQKQLVDSLEVVKREIVDEEVNPDLEKAVLEAVSDPVREIVRIADKKERESRTDALMKSVLESLEETFPESEKEIKQIVHDVIKKEVREKTLSEGKRIDGRSYTEIRPITIDPGFLPRTHGSALFTRGETQALVVLTLGTKRDEQIVDEMDTDLKKNYMLHYNFPPYSVGEVGRIGFTSRREIGHGNLAERALKPVLPRYEDFPYTIRLVSEILESNGSSSMASVCGGSLALMDAGVPIRGHVAGIAMGLIYDEDRYAILSDILGAEDHLGDMDFKVAGTKDGITAIQLDMKIDGISFELLTEALHQAKEGRDFILGKMSEALPEPRSEISPHAPRIMTLQINPEKIGELIGPGGKNIKRIIADTECQIEVEDDGTVTVSSPDAEKCKDAVELVKSITMVPEVGAEFDAIVTRLMTFGAFVEFAPGREGLVHISELDWNRTERVEDVLKPGDHVKVKLIKVDDQGRYDFSRKALLPKPEGYRPPAHHSRSDSKRHQHSFRKKRF
ncbi:MAG: polyribonucleotide nucleotidyltransferase [FCB group bacterium]|nr:polyribonucleotide nucleotidyltransferase [FCB group bacterium]